jgi:hypothetical protein
MKPETTLASQSRWLTVRTVLAHAKCYLNEAQTHLLLKQRSKS